MSNRARLAVSGVWVGISFWNAESYQVVSIMTGKRVLGGPVPSDWIHMWLLWAPCLLSVMMFAHYCLETFAEP